MDWIVAGVLAVAGVIAVIGLYLGFRDPVTRRYKPKMSGLFILGRAWRSPEPPSSIPERKGPDSDT
jgi:hypothetical protein